MDAIVDLRADLEADSGTTRDAWARRSSPPACSPGAPRSAPAGPGPGWRTDCIHVGKNGIRIRALITTHPTVISAATSIRDAARFMVTGHFRHLPVVGEAGLIGMVDVTDVCAALLDTDAALT
jgi:CBS domain-containing protein